jgi:hypothetical protein
MGRTPYKADEDRKTKTRKARPPVTSNQDRVELELHDYAPKSARTHHAAATKASTVKDFHIEPWRGEVNQNDTLKRVITPAGITAVGAEALSFRPENPSHHSQIWTAQSPRVWHPTHDLGAIKAEVSLTPGSSIVYSSPHA